MNDQRKLALDRPVDLLHYPYVMRAGLFLSLGLVAISLGVALLLPKGYGLTVVGDALQVGLVGATTVLALQNFFRSHSRVRVFWLLISLGAALWLASLIVWSVYEVWYGRPAPDVPLVDVLLFVKLVPFTAAVLLEPHRSHDSRFRAFGLLDVSILMLYSLYLYAFGVFAYRLIPGATDTYNLHFNVADAIGNQMFTLVAAIPLFRTTAAWRGIYRIYFFAAACYCLGAVLSNVAIDSGRYYTGSLYDVPLIAAMAAFVYLTLAGRSVERGQPEDPSPVNLQEEKPSRAAFLSSHLAMLVTISTPVIGLWLLTSDSSPSELFPFRMATTLLTIFLLTLLLSIKQDLLTAGLIGSLSRLSETYSSINRLKSHLTQSEKLASLGEVVAQVAKVIKGCMSFIRQASNRMAVRSDSESRIQSMAGKIGQYAQRTDALVENMLRFAQETPLQFAPIQVRPLLESALQLSRITKIPDLHVDLAEEGPCPQVRGDSSQLLHVFLQIIANAIDALEESGGGSFEIFIRRSGTQLCVEFADSGAGLKEPERVFEPFYTTKPVGKGTGLGLSTCYGIIQQHEGEISCRNRPEGGALFSIQLPVMLENPLLENDAHGLALEDAR
jgi:signal transduction histidine kinase